MFAEFRVAHRLSLTALLAFSSVSGAFAQSPAAPHRSSAPTVSSTKITHPILPNVTLPADLLAPEPKNDGSFNSEAIIEAMQKRQRLFSEYFTPTMSQIGQNKNATIYSRDINRITAVAIAGSQEWLGTKAGVKCVDRKRGQVRIYGEADGLPYGSVDTISADSHGHTVAAFVRVQEDRIIAGSTPPTPYVQELLAVCIYNPRSDRWIVADKLPISVPNSSDFDYGTYQKMVDRANSPFLPQGHLVVTDDSVIVVPVPIKADSPQPYFVYDNKTGQKKKSAPISDEALQVDHPYFIVNAIARRGTTLYLGTNIGLLAVEMRTGKWERLLPTREIWQIVSQPGKENEPLWLFFEQRYPANTRNRFAAVAFSPRTKSLIDKPIDSVPNLPSPTLTIDDDGNPWLVGRDFFYRYDKQQNRWRRIESNGKQTQQASAEFSPNVWPMYQYRGSDTPLLKPIAAAQDIPDAVIINRILLGDPDSHFSPSHTVPTMRWIRERLGRWMSPAITDKDRTRLDGSTPTIAGTLISRSQYADDPNDTTHVFALESGRNLVYMSRSEQPKTRLSLSDWQTPDMPYLNYLEYEPPGKDTKIIRRFSPDVTDTAAPQEKAHVLATSMLAVPNTEDSVLGIFGASAIRFDLKLDQWTESPTGLELFGYPNKIALVGPGKIPFISSWQTESMLRLNPQTNAFEPTTIKRDAGQRTFMTSNGLWRQETLRVPGPGNSITFQPTDNFQFLPIGKDGSAQGEWRSVAVPKTFSLPTGETLTRYDACGYTGSIVWFRMTSNSGGSKLIGYDARHERFTVPLPFSNNSSSGITPVEQLDGAILVADSDPTTVHQYQADVNAWVDVTERRLPPSQEATEQASLSLPIVATDGTLYTVNNRVLSCYDSATKQWENSPLPPAITANAQGSDAAARFAVAATRLAVYVSTDNSGLWRYDRAKKTWSEVKQPVTWGNDPKQKEQHYYLDSLAVANDSVWLMGKGTQIPQRVLIRWDRKDERAHFISEAESGIPYQINDGQSIKIVGNSVLLWSRSSGIYRADKEKTHFTQVWSGRSDNQNIFQGGVSAPDDPQVAFFLTGNQILRYDDRTQTVSPFGTSPLQGMQGIVVTNEGVYVGTRRGVYRSNRKGGTWKRVEDTVPSNIISLYRTGNLLCADDSNTVQRIVLKQ